MANSKRDLFQKRRLRVRNKLGRWRAMPASLGASVIEEHFGPADRRREGRTLAAASTLEPALGLGKNNKEAAAKVGAEIAARAKAAGIEEVYFDRGGFLFHGKVKALPTTPARAA